MIRNFLKKFYYINFDLTYLQYPVEIVIRIKLIVMVFLFIYLITFVIMEFFFTNHRNHIHPDIEKNYTISSYILLGLLLYTLSRFGLLLQNATMFQAIYIYESIALYLIICIVGNVIWYFILRKMYRRYPPRPPSNTLKTPSRKKVTIKIINKNLPKDSERNKFIKKIEQNKIKKQKNE